MRQSGGKDNRVSLDIFWYKIYTKWIKEGKVFSKKIGEIGKGMTLQPSAALSNMYGQLRIPMEHRKKR